MCAKVLKVVKNEEHGWKDYSYTITALQFTGEDGNEIISLKFGKNESAGEWVTYQIPLGHEIVGMRTKTDN